MWYGLLQTQLCQDFFTNQFLKHLCTIFDLYKFSAMYKLKLLTSEATTLAAQFFKRAYKISHPPQL